MNVAHRFLAVGEVEIPVVVLGIIGAVLSGSSIVSCQLQINIPPFQRLGGGRSSFAAESAACVRQIIPSSI